MLLPEFSWLTFNTAAESSWQAAPMSPEELAIWEPVLSHGGQLPTKPEWSVNVEHVEGGAIFLLHVMILPGLSAPALHWGVAVEATGAAALWLKLEAFYEEVYSTSGTAFQHLGGPRPGVATQPQQLPWAAEVLEHGIMFMGKDIFQREEVQQLVTNAFWHIYKRRHGAPAL